MRSRALLVVAIAGFAAAGILKAQDPTPAPAPAPPPAEDSPELRALIQEGIQRHDRGDYDAAIERYERALALDPGNPEALYEIAYSLYAQKKLPEALESAKKSIERSSRLRPAAYVLIGNIQDDLKHPDHAIEAYRAGLAIAPGFPLLHFNLGLTYLRRNDLAQARQNFQAELDRDPNHPGSHYWLGRTYMQSRYRVPALLALSRFLVLEPRTARSSQAVAWIGEIFSKGVTSDGKGNVEIQIDTEAPKDEGDFSSLDLMVAMSQAASPEMIEAAGGKLEHPPDVQRLSDVLLAMTELEAPEPPAGFAARHYGPYYSALVRQKHLDAFVYYALQASPNTGVADWLTKNRKPVEGMLSWSKAFRWTPFPATTPSAAPGP